MVIQNKNNDYLTIQEAAERLGVHGDTIRRWIKHKRQPLPHEKLKSPGRQPTYLVKAADLVSYAPPKRGCPPGAQSYDKAKPPRGWLTTAQAAERLGVAYPTVMKYITMENDPLPATQHQNPRGYYYLIKESDLKAFVPPRRRLKE